MNISPPTPPEAQGSARKSRSGNFFSVDLPTVKALIDRGMSSDDLLAYLVLGAGTDRSNTLTRSGRQAIATALNCTRYAASYTVTRLVKIGAIVSLEEELVNLRDPTATRFRLPLVGDISIADADVDGVLAAPHVARLPNSLVQDKLQAASLCRAVRVGGLPVLTTLLQIATDPAQIAWPPEIYADIEMEKVGRIGSNSVARLDLVIGMTDPSRILFNKDHEAILLLAGFGILCLDFYTAMPQHGSGQVTMIAPVATVSRGFVALEGPYEKTAILSLLAARKLQNPGGSLPEREVLLAEFRQGEHMIAVLPASMQNVRVIMRPRLATLPRDPETLAAELRLVSAGSAAAQDILAVLIQNSPDIAAYGKALIRAAP